MSHKGITRRQLLGGLAVASVSLTLGDADIVEAKTKRYGKLQVLSSDYKLKIKWVTYDSDGSVFSRGDNLLIKGTWQYDLDYGQEGKHSKSKPDFWWNITGKTKRYIKPREGAKFAISGS